MIHLASDVSWCKLKVLLEVMSLYKCYTKLRQTGARYQNQNYLKTAQWDYEKGGVFWWQLQLVNCIRKKESQEGSIKILHFIMLGYTVSLLFTSIQIKYVYFLKMLLVLRNYNICNYMPEISLGTEVFTLCVQSLPATQKVSRSSTLCLGGQLCVGNTRMKIFCLGGLALTEVRHIFTWEKPRIIALTIY